MAVAGLNANIGVGRPSTTEKSPRSNGSFNTLDRNAFRAQLNALQERAPVENKNGLGEPVAAPMPLKFSNHAVDRMRSRGVSFSPEDMGKIQNAVAKAAAKGSKDTLLITDQAAMIVSVKDNTVVTVMDKASLKENVFTNIDSTVVV